jgi:hypothetical protein
MVMIFVDTLSIIERWENKDYGKNSCQDGSIYELL